MRRSLLQAVLGIAALLLQIVLPAVHPEHGQPDAVGAHAADHDAAASITGHDALDCPLCAAVAHGRAATLATVPVLSGVAAPAGRVAAPLVPLLAAPARRRAAPRGPPALA